MASILSSPSASHSRRHLEVPAADDEHQRGRKRRRSSANLPPAQIPSGGSTTLRGRGRRRSQSLPHTSPQTNSATSRSPVQTRSHLSAKDGPRSSSPSRRKYQKKSDDAKGTRDLLCAPEAKKRRNQSPSRSRSIGGLEAKPRRRQRTRSRSREHGVKEEEEEQEEGSAEGEESEDVAIEDDEDDNENDTEYVGAESLMN